MADLLPDEVLIQIFSALDLTDRKSTRLVNRRWNILNDTWSLVSKDVFVVTDYYNLDEYISPCRFHIANMRIEIRQCWKDTKKEICNEFWKLKGDSIKCLYVAFSHVVCPKVLVDIFAYCKNLEHFTADCTPAVYSCECDAPEMMFTDSYNFISFGLLVSVPSLHHTIPVPRALKSLINSKFSVRKLKLQAYECYSSDGVFPLICREGPHLEEFKLVSYTTLTQELVSRIIDSLNPKLTVLEIRDVETLSMDLLYKFITKFQHLKQVALFGQSTYSASFCEYLPLLNKLTHVSILDRSKYCNRTLDRLKRLHNLTSLELFKCRSVTRDGLVNLLGSKINSKLVDLRLIELNIGDDCIKQILPNLPNLKFLCLQCSDLTDYSLKTIYSNCLRLKSLKFRSMPKLKSLMRGLTVNNLKELINLDVCFKQGTKIVRVLRKLRLRKLKILTLSHQCGGSVFGSVESVDLAPVFKKNSNLRYVLDSDGVAKGTGIYSDRIMLAITKELKRSNAYQWGSQEWGKIPYITML